MRIGNTPPSSSVLTGVCVPVIGVLTPAGVPIPLNGVRVPDGGAGICKPSGLAGTMLAGKPGMRIREASLL